jgi:hypothetical protein
MFAIHIGGKSLPILWTIVGSMLLTTTISWTIDATVQVCTATVSFSGKEKTRLSPVASASPVRALP